MLLLFRSSSAAAAYSPADEGDLIHRYDASDTESSNIVLAPASTRVEQWNDKGSGAAAATQGTSSAQPNSGVSTLNGVNVVTFDGGDSLLGTNAILDMTIDKTIFCLASNVTIDGVTRTFFTKWDSANAERSFMFGRAPTSGFWTLARSNTGVGTATITAGNATVAPVHLAYDVDGTSTFYVDGVSQGTFSESIFNSAEPLTIGRNVAGNIWIGDVAEILVFNKLLSAAAQTRVLDYLNTKWGT